MRLSSTVLSVFYRYSPHLLAAPPVFSPIHRRSTEVSKTISAGHLKVREQENVAITGRPPTFRIYSKTFYGKQIISTVRGEVMLLTF